MLALKSSGKSRTTSTVGESSGSTGRMSPVTTTSKPLIGTISQESIWSVRDFHANPLAKRGNAKANMTTDGSGLKSLVAFGRFDQTGCFWRTYPDSSRADSKPFSGTLPISGTLHGGIVYTLPHSGYHRKKGLGSFSWPRPLASDGIRCMKRVEHLAKHVCNQRAKQRLGTGGGGVSGIFEMCAVEFGQLPNPSLSEWIMGFPEKWTVLEPVATRCRRRSRKRSGG